MGIGWTLTPIETRPPSSTADGWTPDYTWAGGYAPAADSDSPWFGKASSFGYYRADTITSQIAAASQGVLTLEDVGSAGGVAVTGNATAASAGAWAPIARNVLSWSLANMAVDWISDIPSAAIPRSLSSIGRPFLDGYAHANGATFYTAATDVASMMSNPSLFSNGANWTSGDTYVAGVMPYPLYQNAGGFVLSHPSHGSWVMAGSSSQRLSGAAQAPAPYCLAMVPDRVTGSFLELFAGMSTDRFSVFRPTTTPFANVEVKFRKQGLAEQAPVGGVTCYSGWGSMGGDWRKHARLNVPAIVDLGGYPVAYYTTGDVVPAPSESLHWLKGGYAPQQQWHSFTADGSVWLTWCGAQCALRLSSAWTEASLAAVLYRDRPVKVIP